MNQNVAICTEDMPLEQVFELIDEGAAHHVCVVESYAHRKPIGLITEHDICLQIIGRRRSPRGLTAANVMNTRLVKTDANQSLSECAKLFDGCDSKAMCIVDESGVLSGTIRRRDLESALATESGANMQPKPYYANYQIAMDRIF